MAKLNAFIAPAIFLIFCIPASAQDITIKELDSLLPAKTSYFKATVTYLSDNVYLGRKDSVKVPYISPEILYHFKSGIFLNATASYLPTESRMDAFTIGGGYSFTKKKLDGSVTVDKYFYSSQSYSVRSEVKGDVSAEVGYDFGPIEPGIAAGVSFANKSDYDASFSLEHSFYLFDEKADLTPSFVVNASTQNSYASYYQNRKYKIKRKGKPATTTITANALNASQFQILDYELSAPFNYVVKKLTFNFTPTVAIPLNPNVVILTVKPPTGPATTRTFTEKIGTAFFWSLGISYKL